MGDGAGAGDIRNDFDFFADRFYKAFGARKKSNDRCNDAGDEWLGSYDAVILTPFRRYKSASPFRKNKAGL